MSMTMKKVLAICLLLVCTFPLLAQKIYQVNEVSEINLGDGRFLYRDTKKEKPLNGEFRIIDGYRSQYVQAEFKEGMFDGKYQEYSHNALRREGSYKEGRKNGLFREYVGGALTQEYTFRNDTLDGAVISYFQNGKVSRSAFFKNGREHGNFKEYNHETDEVRSDNNYEDGLEHGRQWAYLQARYDYTRTYTCEHGKRMGKYEERFVDTDTPKVLGKYENGMKTGCWLEFNDLGDTLSIENYANDLLDGEKVVFTGGVREEIQHYKAGKKDGLFVLLDYSTGKPKRETNYKNGRKNGTERVWVTSNRNDFIETYTYVNDRRHGPYEAVYQEDKQQNIKAGTLKSKGQYRSDSRSGHWISYDTTGKIEKEWDE